MERIRAFIAIEMPETVRAALSALETSLQPEQHTYVKWVAPSSIHLTLKFLGNIPQRQVPEIVEAVTHASTGIPPFQLHLGELGAFPNLGRPRVIWVGLTGEVDAVMRLQRSIDQALVPLGFDMEARPFTAHLTLGRLRERATHEERRRIGGLVTATQFEAATPMSVREVSLMRSRLTPAGAIYSRLASVELKDA
ncbi:MAG: RNA 2',3'-cyclic phosphodiesterase [Chloroflexota bacterium]|nr:RNA 2',3'-cyclic phosphodiesterase [Chloroflexota bacterium]